VCSGGREEVEGSTTKRAVVGRLATLEEGADGSDSPGLPSTDNEVTEA